MDPVIATQQAAGADLRSTEEVIIPAGESRVISTGYLYHVAVPDLVGFLKGRSGLAFNHRVVAFEGTIDSDFSGKEVKVLLFNHGEFPYTVKAGERVAQLVICKQVTCQYFRTQAVERTNGFGSTGK